MFSFIQFLITEAKGSGYDDEHATANLWNHATENPDTVKSPDHLKAEIEKARKNKKHPLNFHNQTEGFTGGKKPHHEEAYYEELHRAAHTVHGLANHPELKKAFKAKAKASVAGATKGKLSSTWTKNGGSNATSKADIVISGKGHHHPISLKKGDSQLMSAQGSEFKATYDHATDQHMKANKKFTAAHKKAVMAGIDKVNNHLSKMAGASPDQQRQHRDSAQKILDKIHSDHPGLLSHVHHEASTGEGKFGGKGSVGSARFLVTSTHNGAHIHDVETNKDPIVASHPRVALPKGEGRPGNVKIDYKTVKAK